MLAELAFEFEEFIDVARQHLSIILTIIGGLWIINIINWTFGGIFRVLGIIPRKIYSLHGIMFSSFIHGNFNHLFFNSIPLFVLGLFMLTMGIENFYLASIIIILGEGTAVWLLARPGIHIGASGVIAGYFSYVLTYAYTNPSIVALFLAGIALYYFGGIILSLFPTEDKISWEGHLFGFSAGLLAKYLLG
ncbi:MAG: rhomboid family intramembrane serine protease [Thiotrichales bacterium]|nr:MAG: rhomboid family intramembrane serine protease [Thiotrichales bacterium]